MGKFRVTYEVVTPESSENGEAAESGFVTPGDWHCAVDDEGDMTMTLRQAAALASPDCDSGTWFSECSGDRVDYMTGAVETRAIHPPRNITRASYLRVKRALGIK